MLVDSEARGVDMKDFLLKTVGYTCIAIGTVFVLGVIVPYLLSVGTIWAGLLGVFFLLCPVVMVAVLILDYINYGIKYGIKEEQKK